jgi:hypothetical protein
MNEEQAVEKLDILITFFKEFAELFDEEHDDIGTSIV